MKTPLSVFVGVSLMACLCPRDALAWWETGHELTAQIAQTNITAETQAQVTHVLSIEMAYPGNAALNSKTNTLVAAASWADAIGSPNATAWKSESQAHFFSSLHFINAKIDSSQTPEKELAARALNDALASPITPASKRGHVVVGIKSAIKVLMENSGHHDQKSNLALRFLIHLAGDIHQPVHCGDPQVAELSTRGGNSLGLTADIDLDAKAEEQGARDEGDETQVRHRVVSQFHALWDAAGGGMASVEGAAGLDGAEPGGVLAQLARKVETDVRGQAALAIDEPRAESWASESVYEAMVSFQAESLEGSGMDTRFIANEAVQEAIAKVSERRIYQGGCRLGKLLDALFDPEHADAAYAAYAAQIQADSDVPDIYARFYQPADNAAVAPGNAAVALDESKY